MIVNRHFDSNDPASLPGLSSESEYSAQAAISSCPQPALMCWKSDEYFMIWCDMGACFDLQRHGLQNRDNPILQMQSGQQK